jgi:ribosomal protein S6--L-glutamate ligase
MEELMKYIILNAGSETRRSLVSGLGDLPSEHYKTKRILLHISEDGTPLFLHRGTPIDWSGTSVFTRLRATDQQFCGILYDYFAHENISANDPINRSYPGSAEKISQMLTLALAGIRIPETFVFREESFRRNHEYLKQHVSFPAIFKTDGSKGRNVHYVSSWEELEELTAKKKPHILALVQPFIENEYDTRTVVAYGEILGTIARTRTGGYLNNIAQGAVPSAYTLTEEESSVAVLAANACGIDVAGVDMIHTPSGPLVIEVNKSPQIKGFESVHNFKVFERVAEILRKKSGA